MAFYEHIFLARQDVTTQQVEALTEQIKSKIASMGGAVTKVEPWGLKSLAYRISKNRKAHFTLLNVSAPSEAIVEVERMLGINEDVIRYFTLRVEEARGRPIGDVAQARRRRARRSRAPRAARRPPRSGRSWGSRRPARPPPSPS